MLLNICYKKILTGFLFFISLFIISISCDSTEPTDELKPGRRDYTWTVDTLNIPFTTLQRIWGSSPSDVWAVGPGGDKDKTIYHFNGTRWSTDGMNRPLAPTSIFGFSHSNVWIGGRGGEIWNYDGNSWKKIFALNIPGYNFYGFENIWGDKENNIYAVGYAEDSIHYKGTVVKYNGSFWQNVDIQELQNSFVKILRGSESSNNYFILAYRIEPFAEDTSYIYEFDGINLNKVYQGITSKQQIAGLSSFGNKIYIREGYNIFEYNNNKLDILFTLPDDAAIWGRNKMDILLGLQNGIAHYNGSNVQYLYHFNESGINVIDGFVFENEVFILCYDFNNSLNLIIHGRLK